MTSDQIQSKIDILKSNLERLDEIPQGTYEEFAADFRNVAATLYLLQTSIQALIDVGGFLVSKNALATPRSSHEVFERLEEAGLVAARTCHACCISSWALSATKTERPVAAHAPRTRGLFLGGTMGWSRGVVVRGSR